MLAGDGARGKVGLDADSDAEIAMRDPFRGDGLCPRGDLNPHPLLGD